MDPTRGPEVTFAVHPRPESDRLNVPVDSVPLPAHVSPTSTTQAEDVSHHRGSFLGELAFLVRFAFGRY